jgi:hypothetical protein
VVLYQGDFKLNLSPFTAIRRRSDGSDGESSCLRPAYHDNIAHPAFLSQKIVARHPFLTFFILGAFIAFAIFGLGRFIDYDLNKTNAANSSCSIKHYYYRMARDKGLKHLSRRQTHPQSISTRGIEYHRIGCLQSRGMKPRSCPDESSEVRLAVNHIVNMRNRHNSSSTRTIVKRIQDSDGQRTASVTSIIP